MTPWDNKLTIEDVKKVMDEIEAKMPCNEQVVFDDKTKSLSKENYARVTMMLIKLMSNDNYSERLIVYDQETQQWIRLVYQENIPKYKLSKITYLVSINTDKWVFGGMPMLKISIIKDIKNVYKKDFEFAPFLPGPEMKFPVKPFDSKYPPTEVGFYPNTQYMTFNVIS